MLIIYVSYAYCRMDFMPWLKVVTKLNKCDKVQVRGERHGRDTRIFEGDEYSRPNDPHSVCGERRVSTHVKKGSKREKWENKENRKRSVARGELRSRTGEVTERRKLNE